MLQAGLIGAVVGFVLGIILGAFMPLCNSCVALAVGLGVGGLAGVLATPAAGSTSAAQGAKAGTIAGVGSLLGQISGAVLMGFLFKEDLAEMYSDFHIPGIPAQSYWLLYPGLSCLLALVNVGLMAGLGAWGGLLWYQIAGKKRQPLQPTGERVASSTRKRLRKIGVISLVVAAVCLGCNAITYWLEPRNLSFGQDAVLAVGILGGITACSAIIFLAVGIGCLVGSFVSKT